MANTEEEIDAVAENLDRIEEGINEANELMEDGNELGSEDEDKHQSYLEARDCYMYQLDRLVQNTTNTTAQQQLTTAPAQQQQLTTAPASQPVGCIISTAAAGPIGGPYSQGVVVGQTLYLSGSIGLDPQTGQFAGEGVQEQARQVLKNLGEVLKAAGASYKNVVKTNVFLQDMNDLAVMNEVYSEFFTDRHPARSTVQVAALPRNAKVEIEGVAFLGDIQDE